MFTFVRNPESMKQPRNIEIFQAEGGGIYNSNVVGGTKYILKIILPLFITLQFFRKYIFQYVKVYLSVGRKSKRRSS